MLAEPRVSTISGDRRHITSKYTDGAEVYEAYDLITDELLVRRRRVKNSLGAWSEWAVEIGNERLDGDPVGSQRALRNGLIAESNGAPELMRRDTKEAYIFRIRNLPYPKEVFQISVEGGGIDSSNSNKSNPSGNNCTAAADVGEIVVRTTNKKYFKRLTIPDMQRAGIPLDASHLSYEVKLNTLIINYKKHLAILTAEAAARKERLSMPATRTPEQGKGAVGESGPQCAAQ